MAVSAICPQQIDLVTVEQGSQLQTNKKSWLYPGIAPGWVYFFQPTKKPIYSKVKMLQTKKQETEY